MNRLIQPPAIGILGVIGCFVAIVGNSLCQITERLLFIRVNTEPPKRLLDQYICGHTHH